MPSQYEVSISPISAKGDILSSDGSSRTRFAVGSDGSILSSVSSASSGLGWSTFNASGGSIEMISTTTLTANASSVTFSNIPTGYTDLKIVCAVRGTATSDLFVEINSSTATQYSLIAVAQRGTANDPQCITASGQSSGLLTSGLANYLLRANEYSLFTFDILQYQNTSIHKTFLYQSGWSLSDGSDLIAFGALTWKDTSAITSIKLERTLTGAFYGTTGTSGSTFTLYGIKRYGQ